MIDAILRRLSVDPASNNFDKPSRSNSVYSSKWSFLALRRLRPLGLCEQYPRWYYFTNCTPAADFLGVCCVLGCVDSFAYSCNWLTLSQVVIIYILRKRRLRLSEILRSNSNISTGAYLRLLVIAVIGTVVLVPLCLWLIIDPWSGVYPWPGWKATHAHPSYIEKVPASVWRSDPSLLYNLEITRWEYVLCAFLFFACFGLHREARESYQSVIRRFVPHVPRGVTGYFILIVIPLSIELILFTP